MQWYSSTGGGNSKGGGGRDDFFSRLGKTLQEVKNCNLGRAKVTDGKFRNMRLWKVDKNRWISKDTAYHAGAAFKEWIQRGGRLNFRGSLDEDLNPFKRKHESLMGTFIQLSDLKLLN